MTGRARRTTAKVVDYAKVQEFSDDDIFEDDAEKDEAAPKPAPQTKRRGRPRKHEPTEEVVEETDFPPPRTHFTEKGYDSHLPPIRERFPFLPELEPDGSPRIELIVGRRKVERNSSGAKGNDQRDAEDNDDEEEDNDAPQANAAGKRGRKRKNEKEKEKEAESQNDYEEYEYLIKYKGKSYLHLDWKTGGDLESMNKSAKTLYRRFLKKLAAGAEEDLEDTEFDPSYAQPQKVVDEAEHEVTVELTDKELLEWEKEREKEIEEEEDESDDGMAVEGMNSREQEKKERQNKAPDAKRDEKDKGHSAAHEETLCIDRDLIFSEIPLDKLRRIVNKDGPYYQVVEGSTNPYRDGYITEPPKKPRASYLFFQCSMRSYFQKRNPDANQAELMTILGDTWRNMGEHEQAPFIHLAREEAEQYDRERALMDKAQRPNNIWQPMRRCQMVLDRLSNDGFASIFLEPVDLQTFPDYDEVVDQPMDLGTVRKKLNTKKYQAPENFARDMRKIWNNCKVYNQHGSAIWFVADYMSKQFERLYHAWVQEFRDRYLRWAHPKARPWEHTCRKCDGKCGTPDDKMVLCDHCDAMYGLQCLDMKKVPDGAWHCPECKPKLKTNKRIRILSALSEQAARRKAELGDVPKKKVIKKMFLVKWVGLGYEFCTWETKEDINDDELVAEYHRLNNMTPDEPDMTEDELNELLEGQEHISLETAGGSECIADLRVQLYSLSRAFQFAKFGSSLPARLAVESGPKTNAVRSAAPDAVLNGEGQPDDIFSGFQPDSNPDSNIPKEVAECVGDLVHRVVRSDSQALMKINTKLPPLLTGEYDSMIPITAKGLMMNVGEIHGSVAFLGYRTFRDGSKGPAERANLIRNVGDKIIAVDGVSTIDKSFKEVILMLRESGKNKYAFMRFLENRFAVCESELTSVGNTGHYAIDELSKKFSLDRKRVFLQRRQQMLIEEDTKPVKDESDGSVRSNRMSAGSEDEGSEGEFEPDSEDEEMAETKTTDSPDHKPQPPTKTVEGLEKQNQPAIANEQNPSNNERSPSVGEEKKTTEETMPPKDGVKIEVPSAVLQPQSRVIVRQEATRSLSYRLLGVDLGYSSDEGGDEGCAYFVDGVDATFTTMKQLESDEDNSDDEESNDETREEMKKRRQAKKKAYRGTKTIPIKKNEFTALGDRGKLGVAVAMTTQEPVPEEFESFTKFLTKQGDSKRRVGEESLQNGGFDHMTGDNGALVNPSKAFKRSTVKVEQISASTGDVVRVWANAETAAATLQISLDDIRRMLKGQYDEDLGDEVGGFRWRYARSGAEVTAIASPSNKGSKKGKEAFLEFRDKLYDHADPHVYKNNNKLRDYQVDGVNWLASTWYKRHSCILADEMGLGKTVQIVSYIEHLYRVEKIQRPYLVVVPLSTVEHWRREFQGWTDMVCCVYHDRQRVWRDVLREYEWYFVDRPHTPEYLKFDVLVTTYDTLIGDFDVIGQIPWRVAVVDEAHRLRNIKGKLLECMKEISARGTLQYGFQSRVLMTGTPLQNNTQELWTLLNFIEPYKFPSLEEFQASFGNMANREQVEALQRKISPYMLRRVKEDVAKDIPAKEETVIDVELTSIQKQYYRAIFEHNHTFLNLGASRTNAPKLMNIQMELRKCCNHPFLLEGVEQRETERLYTDFVEKGAFGGKSIEDQKQMINEQGYIQTSGKMVLLDKLLPKLRQEDHKVLIFSQMVRMLDLISEYADFRGFRYERLDGRVRGNERQKAIDRFETEKDSFMFLLSTRAGGVGINLTAADTCIIFDSDWNPQNDVQAQARCHRIGQTKDVRIYRLVTSRSFEQEMFDRASKKLGLEQAVLGTFNQDNDDDKPTSKEMEQLLKKGAYALLEDDNDDVTNQFCSDDIDSILAKRTRTRVVEGAKTASWLNKAGMVVSKSKFSTDGTSGVDIDDPDFWQKVMPDFVTPEIMMTKLNELSDLIEGVTKPRGPGRGRGRKKKKPVETPPPPPPPEEAKPEKDDEKEHESQEENSQAPKEFHEDKADEQQKKDADENGGDRKDQHQLSRTNQRKIHKFMSDLKSMMEGILDEAEDDSLSNAEKSACQKLLLTISVKEKLFNEEQRHLARALLKRLEGDRRRRCRTSTEQGSRFSSKRGAKEAEEPTNTLPDDVLILSKQQRRKRRRINNPLEDATIPKRKKRTDEEQEDGLVDEDGYLRHSDSEADWSDVGEDIYQGRKRNGISKKEARRRRGWAQDDDPATAAGRPWPAFPRNVVNKVLGTVLEEVTKHDKSKGGIFSEPVPRDAYPEYYDQIKHPMDYGTMKDKLERGEYRSAQAMQKDFVLVMQNCIKFNAPDSDVVKEAREQALMRPTILRNAAMKHKLFLAEDGSVLEVYSEGEKEKKDDGDEPAPKKKRGRRKKVADGENDKGDETKPKKIIRRRGRKKAPEKEEKDDATVTDNDDDATFEGEEEDDTAPLKKPRIRISMAAAAVEEDETNRPKKKGRKRKVKKGEEVKSAAPNDERKLESEETPGPKRKRRKKADDGGGEPVKRRRKKATTDADAVPDAETESKGRSAAGDDEKDGEDAAEDGSDTGPSSIYLDTELWKKERETLDGSFQAARKNYTKRGPWTFPSEIEGDRFGDVAKVTLAKMSRLDRYSVFAEAVTEDEAPGYYEIIKKPMDFSKMRQKVESEAYGTASKAAKAFFNDFLLVFDNCFKYNDREGEVVEEAARLFAMLPETYSVACTAVAGKRKNKAKG